MYVNSFVKHNGVSWLISTVGDTICKINKKNEKNYTFLIFFIYFCILKYLSPCHFAVWKFAFVTGEIPNLR